jgi:hypothetical protein
MMIVLTLEESDIEYISGFPEYITFSANDPATIYYTLDGSTPDVNSLIAVGNVYLPTSGSTVTIKSIAISVDDTSSVLEVEYKTDVSDLDGPRRLGDEGIAVIPYGSDIVDNLSFNADGDAAQETSIEFSNLDIKASRTDIGGVMLDSKKSSIPFVNFAEGSSPNAETIESTPNDNAEFDPTAKFIIIDGSTDENFENQVVKIVNRTYNTFDPVSNFYKERLGQKEPVVTGNYVRSFYNPTTGVYVSYYWESLESRWIQSVQSVDKNRLSVGGSPEHPFVFRWIQDRALSQLF